MFDLRKKLLDSDDKERGKYVRDQFRKITEESKNDFGNNSIFEHPQIRNKWKSVENIFATPHCSKQLSDSTKACGSPPRNILVGRGKGVCPLCKVKINWSTTLNVAECTSYSKAWKEKRCPICKIGVQRFKKRSSQNVQVKISSDMLTFKIKHNFLPDLKVFRLMSIFFPISATFLKAYNQLFCKFWKFP